LLLATWPSQGGQSIYSRATPQNKAYNVIKYIQTIPSNTTLYRFLQTIHVSIDKRSKHVAFEENEAVSRTEYSVSL
jgi:hypothetical protein